MKYLTLQDQADEFAQVRDYCERQEGRPLEPEEIEELKRAFYGLEE